MITKVNPYGHISLTNDYFSGLVEQAAKQCYGIAAMGQAPAESVVRRALDKAMDYLSLRDHAAGELYQKLCRKFDAHSAAYAVARAGELGLLNDVSFARRRAAELLRKRKSRREILNDLSAKGIDRDTAADVVEELFAETDDGESPELETARALVQRQYAAKLAAGKRDQVAAALARRGFSHAVIREVLSDDE